MFGLDLDIALDQDSPVCTNCFGLIWFQMVFTYAKEKRADMPKEVTSRKDCWYGINCNTMRHNDDHAKKLNHICNQVHK